MASAENRFHLSTEEELENLVRNRDSQNTKSVLKVAERLVNEYTKVDKQFTLEQLCSAEVTVEQLDKYLYRLYANIRKKDGQRYTRKSMLTVRFGLQRLFLKCRDLDIINDDRFRRSKESFKAVLCDLKKGGLGDSKHKAVIIEQDLKRLYDSSALSTETPEGLQNKVFFEYMLNFCNRGRENLRDLKKDDFEICSDGNRDYVTLKSSKLTKNHRGDEKEQQSEDANRMYDDRGIHCLFLVQMHLFQVFSYRMF